MFLKIQYTSAKPPSIFFRVLNEIINDATLTSVSAVTSKATSASWNADLTANIDWANMQLYRTGTGTTALTSNTASHIARPAATAGSDAFEFVLKQKVYDASTLYYTSLGVATTGAALTATNGTALGNAFSSSGWDVTTATTQSTAQGTLLNVTAGYTSMTQVSANTQNYTMWVFLTDNTFLYAFNNSSAGYSIMGYPSLSGLQTTATWIGPYQFSQYTRRDYWNTDANGFIPIIFCNSQRASVAFGNVATDWTAAKNSVSTTTTENPYAVYNIAEILPTNGTAWTKTTWSQVLWGVGNRYSDIIMTASASTATANVQCYGAYINTTSQYRVLLPSLDGKRGYALLPLTWKRNGMLGGNVTDKSGYYLFNGDYFPGDEFTYGGKTYHILPGNGVCQANRLGWAIPKE